METLGALAQAVTRAVASQRIGAPVSLRAHFHVTADHGLLVRVVEAALAAAGEWFGGAATRVYAVGGPRHGEVTAAAEFAGGQTALISAAVQRSPQALVDLLLIGHRGTVRLQEALALRLEGPQDARLREAVERSLTLGGPAEVRR